MVPKANNSDIKAEEILQAIILAETFNSKFRPVSDDVPFAMLPLCGRPLLDYNLELLFGHGYQEVYVFCLGRNAKIIREFVSNSKWSSHPSRFSVKVISADNYMSHGDMMRDLDGKGYIRSDFLLIQSGVISNMNLRELMESHQKNHAVSDGQNLMTVVVRQMSPKHTTRSPDEHFVVVMSPTNKVLHAHFNKNDTKRISIPLEVLEQGNVSIRADYTQTKIVYCSPHVPAIFSDNFDYQDTDDFVKGIIEHEEIMQKSIHLHEVSGDYCACVTNMTLYNKIANDVAKRWAYPYTVESYLRDCRMTRSGYYAGSQAKVDNSASIGPFCVVLGDVGKGSKLSKTFVGRGCVIGSNVVLDEVTLGKDVKIEDNCVLSRCFVADKCTIYPNTNLTNGCVVAPEVSLGPDKSLTQKRFQKSPCVDVFSDTVDAPQDCSKFGLRALAFEYQEEIASDNDSDSTDDEENTIEEKYGNDTAPLSEGFCSDDEEGSEKADEEEDAVDEVDKGDQIEGQEDIDAFFKEVLDSLKRGVAESIKAENLILEINSCKHAYNITINEIVQLTVRAILTLCLGEKGTYEAFMATFKKSLPQILGILKNYVKKEDSQEIAIEEIGLFYSRMVEDEGVDRNVLKSASNVIHLLYEKDILSETVILEWFEEFEDEIVAKHLNAFIEWLQKDDDEDEDDEDED